MNRHHQRRLQLERSLAAITLALCACLSTAAPTTAPTPLIRPAGSFSQEYQLLTRRNIFDQNRRYVSPTLVQVQTPGQETLTLTGLVLENGQYAAFIEDSRGAATTKYHVGDTVDGGKITAAGMDYIMFTAGTRTIRVDLGRTLAGTSPTTTTSATTVPVGPGGDMLERLRQRRLLELQGSK